MDMKLLADTFDAMDRCRKGTTGSFAPLNVTIQHRPSITSQNITANATIKRRANTATNSITWPCPTILFNGGASGTLDGELNQKVLICSAIVCCLWMMYGLEM